MKRIRIPAAALLAAGFFTVVGCGGGERFAPVSGVVTIDGRMVERLHAEMARRTVAIAEAIAANSGSAS